MLFARSHITRLAVLLSSLGSPFVLLPLTVLLVSMRTASPGKAVVFTGALASLGVVPLVLLIRHRVRAGRWSDHDVSDRSHRREFYPTLLAPAATTAIVSPPPRCRPDLSHASSGTAPRDV